MPIQVVCDGCQSEYRLRDELAGKKLKCKHCGMILIAPELDGPPLDDFPETRYPDRGYHPAFDRDKFLVNQKRIAISERYHVYDEEGRPIMYIVRPAHFLRNLGALLGAIFAGVVLASAGCLLGVFFDTQTGNKVLAGVTYVLAIVGAIFVAFVVGIRLSAKRHIYFYTDESEEELLLEVQQDKKVAFITATYTVIDPEEGVLGRFEKNYLYDVLRKKWTAQAPDGTPLVLAREDSLLLALFRRYFGELGALIFSRTNFVILRPGTDVKIGEFIRRWTLFDRYILDLTHDDDHEIDRRMAIALGVLLDTGERR